MNLQALAAQLEGELHTDNLHRTLYATDASIYRELPLGVTQNIDFNGKIFEINETKFLKFRTINYSFLTI